MNKIFRLIWSDVLRSFVPVAEIVSSHGRGAGKRCRLRLLAASLLLCFWIVGGTATADTLPTGGTIVAGSGAIVSNGNTMTVTQDSQRMAADWTSFSIGQNNTVNFQQPSSSAVALNRVTGADASVIQGALNANGQVFLVNPNGVLFSSTAQVNVGALVASTLDITNDDFMAGNDRFAGSSSNAIVNQGNITTHDGGTIALIAARIDNSGTLTANGGNVLMGAGSKVTLDLGGPVKIQVEEAAIDALIEQGGAIKADGGLVYLTARAAGELAGTVINHTGITEAQTLTTGEGGQIFLMGDMDNGRIEVAGTLDASAPNGGDGGFVETSAANVQIQPELKVTTKAENGNTGEWLIDPNDYTVAASGGDITGSQLGTNLGTTNVIIQSVDGSNTDGNGDIFVNDAVSWQSGNTLTLNAIRNIEINAAIDASSGTGGSLVLEYGQGAVALNNPAYYLINAPISLQASGAANGNNGATSTNFSTKLGSDGTVVNYTTITDNTGTALNTQLLSNLDGDFALSTNIGLVGTNNWTPIGNLSGKFTGRFEGLGHTIDGLNVTGTASDLGLFGRIEVAYIGNITLSNTSVEGNRFIGALVGVIQNTPQNSLIVNASSSGSVMGVDTTGSLASFIGGLVGLGNGRIIFSHSSAEVGLKTGSAGIAGYGGLIGSSNGTIENSFATGKVSGNSDVGGLIGAFNSGTIKNTYATGEVSGQGRVGGLLGVIHAGTIDNSYATGKVTGTGSTGRVGGFAGQNQGNINTSYATGLVTGTTEVGGFVGYNITASGVIANSFWDKDASGQLTNGVAASSTGTSTTLIGKTTAQMMDSSTFTNAGWLTTIWSFPAVAGGAVVAGYGVGGGLPYLTSVTRAQDITTNYTTLFQGGMGIDSNPYTITNWTQLQNINYASDTTLLSKYYTLSNNLNSATVGYAALASATANANTGWTPIGNSTNNFIGNFNGVSHTVDNLIINSASREQGLFGVVGSGGTIQNIGVINANITSTENDIGGLAGSNSGTISNAYVTGDVSGRSNIGGLTGSNYGSITTSYATGRVIGSGYGTGGLVGNNQNGTIANSYASVSVDGTGGDAQVGGLVGSLYQGSIANSYATGSVKGNYRVGGLVGIASSSTITNTYASGSVEGATDYYIGGLVGDANGGSVINSFWDKETSRQATSAGGGIGKTTTEMQQIATYSSWDMLIDGTKTDNIYPYLTFDGAAPVWKVGKYLLNYTLDSKGADNPIVYKGSDYLLKDYWTNSIFGAAGSSLVAGTDYKFVDDAADVTGFKNAGTYTGVSVAMLNSNFGIKGTGNTDGTFTITAKALTIAGITAASKTYDGGLTATVNTAGVSKTGLIDGDALTVSSTGTFADKNAGTGKTVNLTNTYAGADKDNYTITDQATATADIGQKALTIAGITAASKTYDGGLTATVNTAGVSKTGLIDGDALTVSSTGIFADKNAGTGKTVNLTNTYAGVDKDNYTITDQATATADITKANLTVTGLTAEGKVYDATTTASLSGTAAVSAITGDSVTLGGTAAGAFADKNVGESKAITVSGLTMTGDDAGNYTLLVPTDLVADINQRPITVVADDKNKVYGNADPSLTWQVTAGSLIGSDTLSGVLTRTAGENVDSYSIDASALANGNYLITANDGELTISQRPITITADAKSKQQGQSDPALTFQTEAQNSDRGLVAGDSIVGSLSREAGEGAASYAIEQGTVTTAVNPNYDINYVGANLIIAAVTVVPDPVVTPPVNGQQQAAQTVAQNTVTHMVGRLTGGTATPTGSPIALTTPLQTPAGAGSRPFGGISGGLNFIEVEGDAAGDGGVPTSAASGSQAGRSASGFMNVFVVRGGVNYGASSSDDN